MKQLLWQKGFSLARLAEEYSGGEEYWKYIVKANNLKPFTQEIKPGTLLNIPSLEEIIKKYPELNELEKLISEKSLRDIAKQKIQSTLGKSAAGIPNKIIDFVQGF